MDKENVYLASVEKYIVQNVKEYTVLDNTNEN